MSGCQDVHICLFICPGDCAHLALRVLQPPAITHLMVRCSLAFFPRVTAVSPQAPSSCSGEMGEAWLCGRMQTGCFCRSVCSASVDGQALHEPLITPTPSWRMCTDTVEYVPVTVHSISGEVHKYVLRFSVNWKEEFKFHLT